MKTENTTTQHITTTSPDYNKYDPYGNYIEGVIVNPTTTIGLNIRTADGRWANCHAPNGHNLIGAHGIRWWIIGEEAKRLDEMIFQKNN